tara:strand:- start:5047 stop:5340 length:294 start_codon:yes stop_codon:yes gene_type:complete
MPEAPMQGAAEEGQEGGSPAEMVSAAGAMLTKIAEVTAQDDGVPEEAKKAFAAALQAFTAGAQALQGGGQEAAADQGAVSMEQGASGAQPESMRRPG